ncbi:MAG: RES family NAD+ phosphorylase [Limisphaerales bacterium]
MTELEAIESALKTAPMRPFKATLVRCVALLPLTTGGAPDYLFTSGQANRYNPAGVRCVYFSEDEATARLEYARRFGTSRSAQQPLGIYFAEVNLTKVVDLSDAATRDAFKLKAKDLSVTWQLAKRPTRTQLLGLVASRGTVAAIRFPSDAARAVGARGFNVVIFRAGVQAPDHVEILGPTKKPLQKWP